MRLLGETKAAGAATLRTGMARQGVFLNGARFGRFCVGYHLRHRRNRARLSSPFRSSTSARASAIARATGGVRRRRWQHRRFARVSSDGFRQHGASTRLAAPASCCCHLFPPPRAGIITRTRAYGNVFTGFTGSRILLGQCGQKSKLPHAVSDEREERTKKWYVYANRYSTPSGGCNAR